MEPTPDDSRPQWPAEGAAAEFLRSRGDEPAALTVCCRAGEIGGVIERLRRHGVAGATALGDGDRATVVSIDAARVLADAVPALLAAPRVELVGAKPIWVWKYRGRRAAPIAGDVLGPRKLTVYTAAEARPLHATLRAAGAADVTVARARLGYVLDDPLRPSRGWCSWRRAPLLTTIVDSGDRIPGLFDIVDDLTGDGGLVTCEIVRRSP